MRAPPSSCPPPDPPPASQRLPPSTPSHSCEHMSSSIEELKEAITKVEASIAKLEEKIDALEPQITEATQKALESGVDQQYWRMTVEFLRKEKQTLLEKENELRKEKRTLLERLAELEKQKGHLLAQSAGGSQRAGGLQIEAWLWPLRICVLQSRRLPGIRKMLYEVGSQFLGFHHSAAGTTFQYDRNEATGRFEDLKAKLLFRSRDKADEAERSIISNLVQLLERHRQPMAYLHNLVKVEMDAPVSEECLGQKILTDQYVAMNDGHEPSPDDVSSSSYTGVSELDPIVLDEQAQYQSIEDPRHAPGTRQAAHLVDHSHCSRNNLQGLDTNTNNFLVLSPTAHVCFDKQLPDFALRPHMPEPFPSPIQLPSTPSPRLHVLATIIWRQGKNIGLCIDQRKVFQQNANDRCTLSLHVTQPKLFYACAAWKFNSTIAKWHDAREISHSDDAELEPIEDYEVSLFEAANPDPRLQCTHEDGCGHLASSRCEEKKCGRHCLCSGHKRSKPTA